MFVLVAVVLFMLGAFGVRWEFADIMYLGLASFALGTIVDGRLYTVVRRPSA
jgi:hypothetical protein